MEAQVGGDILLYLKVYICVVPSFMLSFIKSLILKLHVDFHPKKTSSLES